jgi:hypothetical protein
MHTGGSYMFRDITIYRSKAAKLVKFHIPFLLSNYFSNPPPQKKKGFTESHGQCGINEQMPGNFGKHDT